MARAKLTAGRIRDFECPEGSAQAFLWDSDVPGFAVRATPGSSTRAFIFQGRLNGKALRVTIGDSKVWGIDEARAEARRLQTLIDKGIDPRQEKAERRAAFAAAEEQAAAQVVTVGEAWASYVAARSPKWGEHHRRTHEKAVLPGGERITRGRKNGQGEKTLPGMIHPLLSMRLADLDADRVKAWMEECNARGATQAALMFRQLRAFVSWCDEQKSYKGIVHADACHNREVRDEVRTAKPKSRALQREQLPLWFEAVRKIGNPITAAYLQAALLTGARREELLGLKWTDVDFQWNSLTIRDKVEGERVIPLTPYVASLLRGLKRRNDTPPAEYRILHGKRIKNDLEAWEPSTWVFSSPAAQSGRLQEPLKPHAMAMQAAGLPPFSIHDLRRSFGSLTEWTETPTGVVAQIMGHKPSATAEKHYRVRPLDLLRMWHTKIEGWILEQAGIEQPAQDAAQPLRVISSTTAA
ncbi:site-specific tyrosine recombinase XerC [Azoarcus sp. Aa7]|nr:site-specific tyrosine recombinase XerC [Azoarcus sp. Aa7]